MVKVTKNINSETFKSDLQAEIKQEKRRDLIKMLLMLTLIPAAIFYLFDSVEQRQYDSLMQYTSEKGCQLIEVSRLKWSNEAVYQCGDIVYRQEISNKNIKRLLEQ